MQDLVPVLTLVGFALLLWLLLVRPQARRQRELRRMQSSLEVGDEVMLTSGVYGTVRVIEEDVARVEIADGVIIKVARGAVGTIAHEAGDDSNPAARTGTDTNGSDTGSDTGRDVAEEN